ncbi:hypothetical protein L2E82_08546 [Cichorium intybus]|uniref:Uncharacterized protein n=1 Tax=Cichorium intybus TaxID=13427 RepID=A0ACB9G794_CICIN|nr:hypothetical protein L2E82_08546 [Cichorium intybus]
MADVLELLFRKALFNDKFVYSPGLFMQILQGPREWSEDLDRLINHLKTMMLGYENDETQGLIKEMEVMANKFTGFCGRENVKTKENLEFIALNMAWCELGDGWRDRMLMIIEELSQEENFSRYTHDFVAFDWCHEERLAFSERIKSVMILDMESKLTLSNIGLDWEEMWTFSWLPNLEVLKLRVDACIGEKWETSDDTVFRKLKVLKLHDLDLRQWVCSSDNFPRLQHLVVHQCLNLESIPSGLGKILTLDLIEVRGCSSSTQSSAFEIQKEQESEGNCFLKVHVNNNNVSSVRRLEELAENPAEFQWRK